MSDDELDFITGKRLGPDPVPPRSSGMSDDAREAWELVAEWRAWREDHDRDTHAVLPKHLLALAAEVEQLREALRQIADTPASADDDGLIAAAIARVALGAAE